MRTKEACATRLSFIIATMVSAAIAVWLPAVPAHALNLLIQANNQTCVSINAGSTATVSIPTGTRNCGTLTGAITISSRPGTTAQVLALSPSGSQNQVVIKNVVIKNNNLSSGVVVKITANHLFASTVVASPAQRAYGIGLNASFTRLVNGTAVLAANNAITKTGSYTYSCPGCTDQIGGLVFNPPNPSTGYTVPSVGSTSLNTIPIPAPSLSESPRNCASFGKGCTTGETLQTIVTIFLGKAGDLVTIPGGDHTAAGGCGKNEMNCDPTVFPNAILGALSAAATLQQNTPNPSVNPNDKGSLAVNLICNLAFSCETVDQGSLRFGPAGARPTSVQLKDLNNDGIVDLKATFANQQTGIMCDGENMTTLSGTNTFPGFGLLEFDAPVGFDIKC